MIMNGVDFQAPAAAVPPYHIYLKPKLFTCTSKYIFYSSLWYALSKM